MKKPLLTIGITTYDRVELLRECLRSMLSQKVLDIEVLISNDNPARQINETLFSELQDPRVHYFNQKVNVGEVDNMNFLLGQARGEYFTWLADDDAYYASFFDALKTLISRYPQQKVFFANYEQGTSFVPRNILWEEKIREFSGEKFLQGYLSHRVSTLGCYGVFQTDFLRSLGGMRRLGKGFSPYSDCLLVVEATSAKRMIYVDAPLIFFRTHPDSISCVSEDLKAYILAQELACERIDAVLRQDTFRDERSAYKYLLLKWFVSDLVTVFFRSKSKGSFSFTDQLISFSKYLNGVSFVQKVGLVFFFCYCILATIAGSFRHFLKVTLHQARGL